MSKKVRLLIADAKPIYCRQMKAFMEDKGFDVLEPVDNWQDLLTCIDHGKADILLTELMLPGIDGVELLEYFRDMVSPPEIFIYSVLSTDFLLEYAYKCGVRYFMPKPTDFNVIYRRILGFSSLCGDLKAPALPSFEATTHDKMMEIAVQILHALGVPTHIKGYYQIRSAIGYVLTSGEPYEMRVTTDIYPAVALEYNSTPRRVERNIRSAIEAAWNRGNIGMQHEIFGYTVNDKKGKPTNAEFIAMVADRTLMQIKKIR